MSAETLILLALLIVLPLIQQLIRATRQRNQRLPEPTEMRRPTTLTRTPEVTVTPLGDATPHAPSDAMPQSAPLTAPHAGGRVTTMPTPHRTMGQRSAAGLHTRPDLRRAIVLVAILGPCRANGPYRSAADGGPSEKS
jgi:hypothetical protein